MQRSTAIRHLVEIGEGASDMLKFRDDDVGWPLEELWVTGSLLDDVSELDFGTVVLMLNVEAPDLPWLAFHPMGEWVGERLRLGKRPLVWSYRPIALPPWTCRHRRVVRVWSASAGTDEAVLDPLRTGNRPEVSEPSDEEFGEQLAVELVASRAHLRQILDDYWEPEWRRKRREGTREDHLWRAAAAVTEIEDALDELRT